jgi:hypothetical protein
MSVAVTTLTLGAAKASAETLPASCSDLQAQMAAAVKAPNHGEGYVVQLNGMCDAASLGTTTGVTLPKEANFTLEGAPGTTSGLDGKGVTGTLLRTVESEFVGRLTISNLTFEHADASSARGGALAIGAAGLTLSDDTFLENTVHESEGAAATVILAPPLCANTGSPALAITGSSFRANSALDPGESAAGGAVVAFLQCPSIKDVIAHDVFEANTLEVGGEGVSSGGGLALISDATEAAVPVQQTDDLFDSNRIVVNGKSGDYGGGGEWVQGVDLASVDDQFSRNTLPGTSGANWSWGAGLGILNSTCSEKAPTESTLEDAVVAANSIGAGEAKDLGGAGIYVGCDNSPTAPNHLSLLDSTVTENTVPPGGVAGIDGNAEDHLALANSIVANDVGGSETGGFNGPGGLLTATYSDLCAPESSSPLTGTGNICANPLLADNGDPTGVDVHETRSSPTIDAGSNALVPAGLTTDFYGDPRELPAFAYIEDCGFGPPGTPPAVVDMGASEAAPGIPPAAACACRCYRTPLVSVAKPSVLPAAMLTRRAGGLLSLSFNSLAAGKLAVIGTFKVTKTVLVTVEGHRRRMHKLETVVYGRASYTVSSPGNVTIRLKPTKRALALLAARKRLQVRLSITFTATGELPVTHAQTITVRYVKPRVKHRG